MDYALSRNLKVGWPNNHWKNTSWLKRRLFMSKTQSSLISTIYHIPSLPLIKEQVVSDSWPPEMAMLANVSHLLIAVNSAINIIVYAIKVIFQILIMKGFGLRHQTISVQMSSNEKMTRKSIHRCTRLNEWIWQWLLLQTLHWFAAPRYFQITVNHCRIWSSAKYSRGAFGWITHKPISCHAR